MIRVLAWETNGTVSSYWILEQADEKQNDCECLIVLNCVNLAECCGGFLAKVYQKCILYIHYTAQRLQQHLLETQVSHSSSHKERNVPRVSVMYKRQMEKIKLDIEVKILKYCGNLGKNTFSEVKFSKHLTESVKADSHSMICRNHIRQPGHSCIGRSGCISLPILINYNVGSNIYNTF